MDNKRMYKRLSTCFWFLLATMLFWLPIIFTIFSVFLHLENNDDFNHFYVNDQSFLLHDFLNVLGNGFLGDVFENMPLPFIKDMILNLFNIFELDSSFAVYWWISSALAWFITTYFYELIVDFITWLPRWCHNMLEKGVGKID